MAKSPERVYQQQEQQPATGAVKRLHSENTFNRGLLGKAIREVAVMSNRQDNAVDYDGDDGGYESLISSVTQYLREIVRYPLLTRETEAECAKAIESGKRATEKTNQSGVTLTPEERVRLDQDKAQGEAARKRLTESNLRLVVSVARRYTGLSLPLLDLIQEGNIGLMKAVEKFDWRKECKFSTYATWWIRQTVLRAIADKARMIRLPVHQIETINRLARAEKHLTAELGRVPVAEELAAATGYLPKEIDELRKISQSTVSLETPVGDDEDSNIGDSIEDTEALIPFQEGVTHEAIVNVLASTDLTPRQLQVLKLRFGLMEDGRFRTLEEVGRVLGVTRERVRQIETKAIKELRRFRYARRLRELLR